MKDWFRDVFTAIFTVGHGLYVTLRCWFRTYDPERKAFTQHYEYPELPVPVADRYRGFHRFDLTTCIACDQCAKACPVDCIYIDKTGARKLDKNTGKVDPKGGDPSTSALRTRRAPK